MSTRLENKTALATGATSNIGRAIATAFAAEGAHVIVSGRSRQRGRRGCRADPRGRRTLRVHRRGPRRLRHASRALAADATRALGGRIDVLVINAGSFPASTTPTVDDAMFDQVYAVNVKAPFFLTAAIAPEMTARGSEDPSK